MGDAVSDDVHNRDRDRAAELGGLMRDVARAVRTDAERRQHLSKVVAELAHVDQRVRETRAARRRTRLLATGLTGALAIGTALFLFGLAPGAISFQAGGRAGVVGEPLSASGPTPLALQFSDGSEVMLPSRAQARVETVDRQGATVAVEAGAVDVSVIHRADTRWEVRAGRYRIRVTGTRFRAAWNPNLQELTLTMREGSVLVSGPGIAVPTQVVTGERLRVSAEEGISRDRSDGAGPHPPTAALPQEEPASGPPEEPVASRQRPSRPASEAPTSRRRSPEILRLAVAPGRSAHAHGDWRALAGRAQYREALASAIDELRGEGWAAGCARLDAADVVLVGDVARLAGDLTRADEAYQIARRRFPSADRPTFALGLIAFEGRHDYVTAAGWFESYLRLHPRGPLARESAGRLLEARLKAGDEGAARAAAVAYLRDFPRGPHAELARRTVAP
jgi:transmembrane sensor